MRALLVYNPNATTTTPAVTDVIARALSGELKLDVHATKRRNHASYLAAGAVHEGHEVVIALGGDGTVNEVIQGIAGTPVRLAIIPGGSTNVYARSLGLPNDAVEATSVVLRKLAEGADRRVNLGRANGRYFAFNTGFGFDAEVVRQVEARHRLKRTVRQGSFLYCGARTAVSGFGRRGAEVSVQVEGGEPMTGFHSAVCCNTSPFTYLGPWEARVCPQADLELGLDLTALRSTRMWSILRLANAALRERKDVRTLRNVEAWHDRTGYDLFSSAPLPLQIDGDFVGETDHVQVRLEPTALSVVA